MLRTKVSPAALAADRAGWVCAVRRCTLLLAGKRTALQQCLFIVHSVLLT